MWRRKKRNRKRNKENWLYSQDERRYMISPSKNYFIAEIWNSLGEFQFYFLFIWLWQWYLYIFVTFLLLFYWFSIIKKVKPQTPAKNNESMIVKEYKPKSPASKISCQCIYIYFYTFKYISILECDTQNMTESAYN